MNILNNDGIPKNLDNFELLNGSLWKIDFSTILTNISDFFLPKHILMEQTIFLQHFPSFREWMRTLQHSTLSANALFKFAFLAALLRSLIYLLNFLFVFFTPFRRSFILN